MATAPTDGDRIPLIVTLTLEEFTHGLANTFTPEEAAAVIDSRLDAEPAQGGG